MSEPIRSAFAIESDSPLLPTFRQPPHNFEAEKALLGAMMANKSIYPRVVEIVKEEYFADPVHGRIFAEIARRLDAGQSADAVSLRPFFSGDAFKDSGGARYLAELAGSMVSLFNAADYARQIRDLHLKRQIIDVGQNVVARAYLDGDGDEAETQIADASTQLAALAEGNIGNRQLTPEEQIGATMAELDAAMRGQAQYRKSGLVDYDRMIGGFKPGKLYVIAARPGMGKSALAVALADHGGNSWVYSGEMTANEWHQRRLATQSRIPANQISDAHLNDGEVLRVVEAAGRLDRTVWIDDQPRLDMPTIGRRAKRFGEKNGSLGLVVIDHLGKVRADNPRASRYEQIGQISGDSKNLAKELNAPVVLLCQLSRAVEQREDKRPQLSDLRDSGNIEEDADVVTFLYRHAYYLERGAPQQNPGEPDTAYFMRLERHNAELERCRNKLDLIVAKNRGGPLGSAQVYCNLETMQFGNLIRGVEV